jgi:hypothetical protein
MTNAAVSGLLDFCRELANSQSKFETRTKFTHPYSFALTPGVVLSYLSLPKMLSSANAFEISDIERMK